MSNGKFNYNSILRVLLVSVFMLSGTACSNSGSTTSANNNSDNGDASTLQLITPQVIYSKSGSSGDGYAVINNPTNSAVKNLYYALSSTVGGGSGASLDPVSAANCATIAANSQCNVKITVASGSVAGSFGFSASNDSSLLSKLNKSAKAAALATVVGVEQAAYNTASGADGITLSYYHTVINGTPYVLVSALVASANAGTFNKVVLVNNSGTAIPNQQIIGTVNSTQGSTFNILLPVPTGNNLTQVIKVQTQLVTPSTKAQTKGLTATEIVSTATTSSTLTTTNDVGIVEMLPSAIYLSKDSPEQSITFSNTGNVTAQLQSLVASNPNIEVIFSSTGLSSGGSTTATLKLKDSSLPPSSGGIVLTYYNGQKEVTVAAAADQNVNPAPTPTPTPTPSPTPPAPTPAAAGLTADFSSDNNFFTTTAIGTVSRQMTLSNTGNTPENGIVLTLPANFSISGGSSNSCTVTQGSSPATISNTLAVGTGSCDVTVTYANSSVTSLNSGDISIAYNYNNGMAAPTPITAVVNYKVTQSTANLSISSSPSPANYGSIANDNTAISSIISYTVTNSGDVQATNLNFGFGGTDASLFSYLPSALTPAGDCVLGGSLGTIEGSNTCTINSSRTQFGPAGNGVFPSNKSANFNVDYTPYTGGATSTASIAVAGAVTAAPSATFTSAYNDNVSNPFLSGTGTSEDQYQGYINTSYEINVVYTNTSSIAASNFTTVYTPPANWSMTTHGCNNVTLSANGSNSCTDTYTLNSADSVTTSINLANVTASWTDSSGSYTNQSIAGDTVYANLTTPPIPNITITNLAGDGPVSMMGTIPITFTATISGNGTSTLTALLANSVTGTIISNPSPCALDTAGTTSCTFSIIPWYTGFDNSTVGLPNYDPFTPTGTSINLSATDGATISGTGVSGNAISYIITTPYVYLPAPMEGAATENNTGITWGNGGSVSPRFESGIKSDGQPCADSLLDNLTGLEWAKNGIIGFKSTLYGAPIAQPNYANTDRNLNSFGNWSNANAAISNMNVANIKLCGQSDWRLPTEAELLSLVNYSAPYGDVASWLITEGFINIQGFEYWSITLKSNSSYVWVVNMVDGSITYLRNSGGDAHYILPVRSR